MVKRINTTITTESVNFTAQKAAKTNQAWRYPGGTIQRAPQTVINGRTYTDPKNTDMPRRKNESNFFITINPNKASEKDERINADQAMSAAIKKLSMDQSIAQFIKFGPKVVGKPKQSEDFRLDRYEDVIHSIDWKAGTEKGPTLHRLHAHIYLTVTHYSQVQINVPILQYMFREHYNTALRASLLNSPPNTDTQGRQLEITDLPYVHVGLLPQTNWLDVMKQYIHKGMEGSLNPA